MKIPNNSPARIKQLLRRFNERAGTGITALAWAHAFGFGQEVADYHSICTKLRALESELSVIEATILAGETEHEPYLRFFPALRNATSPSFLSDPASKTAKAFSEEALGTLDFCAISMKRIAPEPEMTEGDIARISKDLEALLTQIIATSIRPKEKRMFLGLANALKQALQDYQIGGGKMLRENFWAIVAKLENYAPPSESDDRKEEAGVFRGLMEILKDVQIATAVAVNSNVIGRGIFAALQG